MKKSQLTSAILIALFMLTVSIEICPKITAPPPPTPDRFIAGNFPENNNTNTQLLYASALITLNATNLNNKIGISFNGSYSLFNPEKTTNLTIIMPLSLSLDFINASFGVSVNNTQIPFEVVSTTEVYFLTYILYESITKLDFYIYYPIILITSNLTLLENYTYVVKYHFEGSIPNPVSYQNPFYMIYSSDSAKLWKGNATERVEYKVFGGNPVFSTAGSHGGFQQLSDIAGGKRFISEWDNAQKKSIQIGIIFYGATNEIRLEMIVIYVFNGLAYVAIASVIVIWIVRRKKKRASWLENVNK